MKRKTWLSALCVVLSVMSFNAFAVYVGNPTRPDTIVVPAHCENGCWQQTYYVKYLNPPVCCRDIYWNGERWVPTRVKVVGSY